MTPVSVLIIIVNYRTPALALEAVASLEAEVVARGDAHVVVVDNGSGDGSAEALAAGLAARGLPGWCSLLPVERNGGFAAGNNEALRWYEGETGGLPDYAWLLNPDTTAHPGAIGRLVDFLTAHPAVGIAGSRCLWEDGGIRYSAFRFPSVITELTGAFAFGPVTRLLGNRETVLPITEVPRRADWVSGSSFMIRRAVIERIGLMDEDYFLYFEESDYCARAADTGFEVWIEPASVITHIGGQSTGVTGAGGKVNRRPRYWFAARARFLVRRYGTAYANLTNLIWLAAYPLGSAIAAARGKARHNPPFFWWDFLKHYYGPGGLMYRAREMRT